MPLIEVCDNHRVEPQLVWLLLTASLYVFDPSDEPLIVAVTGACLAAFMAGAPDSALASNEKICVSEPREPVPVVRIIKIVCLILLAVLVAILVIESQIVYVAEVRAIRLAMLNCDKLIDAPNKKLLFIKLGTWFVVDAELIVARL